MSTDLEAMLEFADKLPSLPTAVVRAMTLLRDDAAPNSAIAAALHQDQALVSQVLKLANSPYYGLSRRVASVEQSILVLGRKAVRSIVVAAASQDFLGRPQEGYLLKRGELWHHSLATGYGAALVAGKVGYRASEEAFVAGLLQSIGKVVLSGYLADLADEVTNRLDGGLPFNLVERELVAMDHATLGGEIADRWQLPPQLGTAIRYQYAPLDADGDPSLACIIHLAKALALSIGIGLGVDGLNYELCEPAIGHLGLSGADLEQLASELVDRIKEPEPV